MVGWLLALAFASSLAPVVVRVSAGEVAPPRDAAAAATAPALLPVPSPEDQDRARRLVKEVFAEDYAKRSLPDRVALAKRLLQQAKIPVHNRKQRERGVHFA